ncbi:MAG: hypothetical protein VXZ40_00675 [Nanoarchaeota archaeon]|nr:hypothetical protein [Nanoarchaeota archaeon]
MKILILNLCSKQDTLHHLEFVRPIEDIVKKKTSKYEIKHYSDSLDYSTYSHVLLSGVPLRDFEYENHLDKFSWIKEFKGKVLGICAGAQVIGSIFDEDIINFQELGLRKIDLVKEDAILENFSSPLEIYGLHNKGFNSKLSFFDVLARSSKPELLKHKKKEIYACIFHPEVRNHILIENFIN